MVCCQVNSRVLGHTFGCSIAYGLMSRWSMVVVDFSGSRPTFEMKESVQGRSF